MNIELHPGLFHAFNAFTLDTHRNAWVWQRRQTMLERYVRFLQSRGYQEFKPAFSGAFFKAILISNCGRYVAKFADTLSDDGYPEFARWACTQNNEHLPKIYTARTLRGCWFLTIMERLSPLPCLYDEVNYCAGDLPEETYHAILDARNFNLATMALYRKMHCNHGGDYNSENPGVYVKRIGSAALRALFNGLQKTFHGFACDTHEGNVMLRGSTPVVIDPYGYRQD